MPTATIRRRFSVLRVGLLTFAALVALGVLAAVAVRSEYQPLPAIKKRPLPPYKPDPRLMIQPQPTAASQARPDSRNINI